MLDREIEVDGNKPPRRIGKQREITIAVAGSFDHVSRVSQIDYAKSRAFVITYPACDTGDRKRLTLTKPRPENASQALLRAAQADALLAQGIDPERASQTVADLFDGPYLDHARNQKRSWRDDQSRFDCYLRKAIGHLRPDQVTPALLQRICDAAVSARNDSRVLKEGTKNRTKALIKRYFKLLELWGYHTTNPAQHLQLYRERNRRTRILQDDELKAFFAALEEAPRQFQLLLRLMLHTAVRLTEALNCRWSSVSIEQATIWLDDTKSGEPRSVPLSAEALEVMQELTQLRTNEFVFPGKSGEGHMARPGRQFRKLIARAGTAGLWLHDLRRTGASLACRNGASIYDVSKLLGHSNVRVTERYVVTHSPRIAAAVQGIGDLIKGIAGEPQSQPLAEKEVPSSPDA